MGCCRKDEPASFQRHLASSVFEVYVCGYITSLHFDDDHQDNDVYDDGGGVGSDIGGNRQCVR